METKIRSKMRKDNFTLLVASAAMLAACSSNDTFKELDTENVMIGFETYHEKATRAQGEISKPDSLDLKNNGFGVWGYKAANAAEAEGDPVATVDVSSDTYTKIFNNVKVWWESNETYDTDKKHAHFTYTVPKYWDKYSEYIFFAYAPYDATNATLDEETGKITIANIPAIQDISAKTGSGTTLKYNGTENKVVKDYLMATYVTNQKYKDTNQKSYSYSDKDQTVGFIFGHMLSKLQVNLLSDAAYSGVKELKVTSFSIKNMPNTSSSAVQFTQKSPTGPSGDYNVTKYTSVLNIVGGTPTTSSADLYLLYGGYGTDGTNPTTNANAMTSIVAPTPNTQQFNYYVAPNDPDGNDADANKKYLVSINYSIKYVDDVTENVVIEDVDLSSLLPKLNQNDYYVLTVRIKLNQILFTVQSITDWNKTTVGGYFDTNELLANTIVIDQAATTTTEP